MKTFKVKISLKTGVTAETAIQARTSHEARKLVEAQYGSALRLVISVLEVR